MSLNSSSSLLDLEESTPLSATAGSPFLLDAARDHNEGSSSKKQQEHSQPQSDKIKPSTASAPALGMTKDNGESMLDKEEEALMQEFINNPKAAAQLAQSYFNASQAPRPQPMVEITPVAGFVVETRTTKAGSTTMISLNAVDTRSAKNNKKPEAVKVVYPSGTAVFLNICSSDRFPKPSAATEAEIQRAINAEEGATYQVPFQLSEPREYRNELAKRYLVVDACVHTDAYKRTEQDMDYRLYIMELAMEWFEERCGLSLSREFSIPNMRSKDVLVKRPVLLPKPAAIQEISSSSSSSLPTATLLPLKTVSESVVGPSTSVPSAPHSVPKAAVDDIVPKNRLVPCPRGTLGILVEIELPNHTSMKGLSVDLVMPDRLIFHSPSQGKEIDGGKAYHLEVDLPNEPLDLDNVDAEFHSEKRVLRVYTIKKRRSLPS